MRVLVIGDSIVDIDVFAEATGLSLESPTLKGKFIEQRDSLGGAANLSKELSKLGAEVTMITAAAKQHTHLFEESNINLINIDDGALTSKTRYWFSRDESAYKVLQINREAPISKESLKYFIDERISDVAHSTVFDKVVVSDYRLGLVSSGMVSAVSAMPYFKVGASQVSSNQPNYETFIDFDLVVCNEFESRFLPGGFNNVCITFGSRGCSLNGEFFDAEPLAVSTSVGAGDAFLAALVSSGDPNFANAHARKYLEQINDRP